VRTKKSTRIEAKLKSEDSQKKKGKKSVRFCIGDMKVDSLHPTAFSYCSRSVHRISSTHLLK
jgi:hypothetical protein